MFLMSYTQFEYVIEGVLIPKKGYSQEQLKSGKKEVVEITSAQLEMLKSNTLFKELLDKKQIRLMDTCPAWALSGEQRISKLEAENRANSKSLKSKDDEIAALKAKLAALEGN